jgi:putative aldouronate transport system substrate-binding protein
MRNKALFILIAALLLSLSGVAAQSDLEPVTLTWRWPAIDPAGLTDLQTIQDAANEIIQAEINAALQLIPIELAEYNPTMITMAAAGEEFDLVYTAWWTFNYWQQAALGAFHPLTDLVDEYAPTLRDKFPHYVWQTLTVDGEIYGLPHMLKAPGPHGWQLMQSLVEEHNFDVSSVQKYEDVVPFLDAVARNNPEFIPAIMSGAGYWEAYRSIHNLEEIINVGIGFRQNQGDLEVIDLYNTPEYVDYVTIMREWWQAGYIWDEAPTSTNSAEQLNRGVVASLTNRDLLTASGTHGGQLYINIPLGPSVIRPNTALPHATGISRTSRNPERALMLVDLIHRNPELLRLLTYGIEGLHYELNEDGRIVRIPDSGYNITFDWPFGDIVEDGYRPVGEDPAFLERHYEMLEIGVPSRILGFQVNTEPISSELAQIRAVNDEFIPQLNTGAGNPESVLPRFLEQRQATGITNIIEEVQRQVDAWVAAS